MDTKDEIIKKLCEIAIHVGLTGNDFTVDEVIKSLRISECCHCGKLADELTELRPRLEPDKGYRTVPFELSEETWKKLTPIERMKFKGLLLEKIPVEPDKKSA